MDQLKQDYSTDLLGLEAGPLDVLKDLLANAEGVDAQASDDDLDTWWGTVEVDRMVSGLTLDSISKLAAPNHELDPNGPWIQKLDANGDESTQLTPAGRAAVRQILSVRG
jgi:hypothetical protein